MYDWLLQTLLRCQTLIDFSSRRFALHAAKPIKSISGVRGRKVNCTVFSSFFFFVFVIVANGRTKCAIKKIPTNCCHRRSFCCSEITGTHNNEYRKYFPPQNLNIFSLFDGIRGCVEICSHLVGFHIIELLHQMNSPEIRRSHRRWRATCNECNKKEY